MSQWIYSFEDAPSENRSLLGGKGAGLAQMTKMGLPVPSGFTITTEACTWFFENGERWPDGLAEQLQEAVAALEARTNKRFGDPKSPLLVSVRSGAAVSMPGMMDTVLNLGLNEKTTTALAEITNNPVFAWDSFRRFLLMFGDVVLGVHYSKLSRVQDEYAVSCGQERVEDLNAEQLQGLCTKLQKVVGEVGHAFPETAGEQLELAINAVFHSYNSHRARYYRKTNGIDYLTGTAVNVQEMVFGNMGEDSGTGVAFTRNPKSGVRGLFGEWLRNAQGEDVVAGIRTPQPLNGESNELETLQSAMPEMYEQLVAVEHQLENHFKDMQDIEFTVEKGKLFVLQTRTGKRTAVAAVQIVVDFVAEGVIDKKTALSRIDPLQLEYVLRPIIAPSAKRKVIAKGLDASPGAACGRVVFDSAEVIEYHNREEPTVLVRLETSPEDIQGMTVAAGVLTARGGQTSHAAVVARGMGKPCVVGCSEIQVDYARRLFYTAKDAVVREGDWITIDGGTGEVMEGKVEMLAPQADSGAMSTLLEWADEVARLTVRANADTGPDAARARDLGATGIGLCRTEHMFFEPSALRAMRRMIVADDQRSKQRALQEILPIQRRMFRELFTEMDGFPVTIRLLDPPLHEFLPQREADIAEVASDLGIRAGTLRARLQQLHEANPMLGHRGVRVGITSPEVYATQVRAIFEAVCEVKKEGVVVVPEIMIPLVGLPTELAKMRALVVEVAESVIAEYSADVDYAIGTMIEVPRATLVADQIAEHADFFSFGTNDLSQLVYGFSRDDMGKFFPDYQRQGVLTDSPLAVFDIEGVGQLVKLGVEKGRKTKPHLKVGICGEHGGDPTGVGFFHWVGLDYVSCSPYRVPVARLAAAHAALGLLDPKVK